MKKKTHKNKAERIVCNWVAENINYNQYGFKYSKSIRKKVRKCIVWAFVYFIKEDWAKESIVFKVPEFIVLKIKDKHILIEINEVGRPTKIYITKPLYKRQVCFEPKQNYNTSRKFHFTSC